MSLETLLPSVHTKATPGPAPGGLGRGLFASNTIKIGEDVLHITSPFVAVLDTPRLSDTCSGCFGNKPVHHGGSLKNCTGCKVVKYCDKECQRKDWKFAHAHECAIFKNLNPRILPSNARALLRMIVRSERQKYTNEELELFSQLETHISEIRDQSPEQWERIALSSKAVKAYSGTDMKEETISAFGAKLELNSFNLTSIVSDRMGLYLHPYAALINHSCNYNAAVGFDGDNLYIKATRPIQQGEQIFISYVDATNPVRLRRSELRERYYFDCQCAKCAKDLVAPAHSFLGPESQYDHSAIESAETEIYELLDECSSAVATDPKKTAERFQSSIKRLRQIGPWPVTEQPLVSLRDELIASLLADQDFSSGLVQAAVRYLRVDPVVYEDERHPVRQLHGYVLARVAVFLDDGADGDASLLRLANMETEPMLLAWSVLSRLVELEDEACTVPSFKRIVRLLFNHVNERLEGGKEPKDRGDDIRKEWEKVELIVDTVLEKEC
ncbi:SET and MYND domain protein [Aspergillus nomiae NRRL 13137]|uniref:SET and MYND domain protein n=1 Tax=Aspergillus nomiae NRRL (strain ATCC 15546 / NRRL 13137 / CBS 260.88 / M93) TaxID=1509407 RepID=A0A0L1J2B3_ASPN3|nr:SET and MYND domain protein [Aspergillus nomiae NRRL 13137]KNG85894.1 SET and MYND domain protein [Aspergillus nomiae NRRL 13137]